jgi:septal ring factor EnvC (AmiA/AmiB activator)
MRQISNNEYFILNSIAKERFSIQKENDSFKDVILALKNQVSGAEIVLRESEKSRDILETKCSNYAKTVEEFREHVKVNNGQIRNLKTQLATYKDCNQGLEDEIVELKRTLNDLTLEDTDIKTVNSELDGWRMRALAAEAKIERINEEEERLTNQLDALISERPRKIRRNDTTK